MYNYMLFIFCKGICVFNMDAYLREFGLATNNETIGYIEGDGIDGLTAGDTLVQINDPIPEGVTILGVNGCNNW